MSTFRTSVCKKFGHAEFSIFLSSDSELNAAWLVSFLESEVRSGKRFKPAETIQIGWMVVMLKQGDSGDLELWEPEFDSMPIRWRRSLDNTLRHLILQKSVADLVGEFECPSLRQAAAVSQEFLSSDGFTMKRGTLEENFSGWGFSTPNDASPPSELKSLFEVSFFHPDVIPFLALPPGSAVVKSASSIEITFGEKTVTCQTNTFLNQLLNMELFV